MRAGVHPTGSADDAPTARDLRALELVRSQVTTAATLAHERTLPVAEGIAGLIPNRALTRGTSIAVHGVGATSLALAVTAEAVRAGSFLAVVAPRSFALAACLDHEIPLRRVVQFSLGESANSTGDWGRVVAAVIEGFDLVLLADRQRVSASHARQLTTRARERGSVLVRVGGPAWAEAADVRLDVSEPSWEGLGRGHGHLQQRHLVVQVAGRRHHGAHRRQSLLLPAADGRARVVESLPHPLKGQPPVPLHAVPKPGGYLPARYAGADVDALVDADMRRDESNDESEPGDGGACGQAIA